MAKKGSGKATGCLVIFGVLIIAGVIRGLVAPDSSSDKAESQASQEADKQEAAKQAREQDQEDAADAKKMGVSVATYRQGQKLQDKAYSDCTFALINSARYEHKQDWGLDYSWTTDGKTIAILGRDVHLQNGFGAYSAGYSCEWDMKTKSVVSVDTN